MSDPNSKYPNDELKQSLLEQQNLNALLNLAKQLKNQEEGRKSYRRFIQERQRERFIKKSIQYFKYAAAVLVLFTLSSVTTLYLYKQSEQVIVQNTLHTPAGQRAQLTLQDGTKVWLNANSTFTYPSQFSGNQRKVQIQGEAFFDVAKDASRPFIVTSGDIEMEVLGTQFNVKHYPHEESLRTSLVEGSVRVYCESNRQGVILEPHQQVTVTEGRMVVSKFCSEDPFLWKEGIYAFNNESLENILNKLELYYDVDIQVKDPSIITGNYTGKFRQRDSLDDIFRVLQQINRFKVVKSADSRVIILKK